MNPTVTLFIVVALITSLVGPSRVNASVLVKRSNQPPVVAALDEPTPTPTPTLEEAYPYPPPGGEIPATPEPIPTATATEVPVEQLPPQPTATETPAKEPGPQPTATETPETEVDLHCRVSDERVNLKVDAEPAIYIPGKPIKISWKICGYAQIKDAEAEIVFTIPTGVVPSKSSLKDQVTSDQTLILSSKPGEDKISWDITETASFPMYFSIDLRVDGKEIDTQTIQIDAGIGEASREKNNRISTADGKVQIDVPTEALDEDLLFSARKPSPHKLPPVSLTGAPLEIIAVDKEAGVKVDHFKFPIAIQVSYDKNLLFGGSEDDLMLFYYNEEASDWYPLHTTVDKENQRLTAYSDHLTVFDYKAASWQAHTLPSVGSYQVSNFTGSGTYDYPFQLPAGAGGFQPNLSLSYNSQTIDEATSYAQASWVGMGWSLDTGAITRNMHSTNDDTTDDTFSISVGGVAGLLLPVKQETRAGKAITTYNTAAQSFHKVEYNSTDENWTVYGKDGSVYFFSESNRVSTSNQACADSQDDLNLTWRWSLTWVKDIFQNTINYTYQKETKSSSCINQIAVYPDTITYSNGKYRVRFEREARSDYQHAWTETDAKVLYEASRLKEVFIEHEVSGQWSIVRSYAFEYAAAQAQSNIIYPGMKWKPTGSADNWVRTLTLQRVIEKGADGTPLPAVQFSYDGLHLTKVENGLGGAVEMEYEPWWYFDDINKDLRSISVNITCDNAEDWVQVSGRVRCDPASNNLQIETLYYSEDDVTDEGVARYSLIESLVKPGAMYRFYLKATAIDGTSGVRWGVADIGLNDTELPGEANGIDEYEYHELEVSVEIPRNYDPASTTLQIACDDCLVDTVEFVLFPMLYRVTQRKVIDTVAEPDRVDTYEYRYDNASPNTAITSLAVKTAGSNTSENLYNYAFRDYRGNALVQETNPAGLTVMTWNAQSDALKGTAFHTVQMQQTFTAGFEEGTVDLSQWSLTTPAAGLNHFSGEDFDTALSLYDTGSSTPPSLSRASYALSGGEAFIAQIRLDERKPFMENTDSGLQHLPISGTAEAEIGIKAQSGKFFGIHVTESGTGVGTAKLRYNTGAGLQDGANLLPDGQFKLGRWYTLLVIVDPEDGFLARLWSMDAPNSFGEQRFSGFASETWRYEEKVKNGSLWLDAYAEGQVFTESFTRYQVDLQYCMEGAASPCGAQTGDTYAAIANSRLNDFYDLKIYWTAPIESVERSYMVNPEEGLGDSRWMGTRTTYEYEMAYQNNRQFGNLTRATLFTWNGSGWVGEKSTRTRYWPLDEIDRYLTALPASQEEYLCTDTSCSPNALELSGATRFLYDGQTNYAAAPQDGKLTGKRSLLRVEGTQEYYSDELYAYDSKGNRIRVKRYTGEGTATALATSGEQIAETCYGVANQPAGCQAQPNGDVAYPLWEKLVLSPTVSLLTSWEYDYGLGVPTSETDPNGAVTYAIYDTFGRIRSLIRPGDFSSSPTMSFVYHDTAPFWTEVTQKTASSPRSAIRKFYNGLGELIQTQSTNQVLADGACGNTTDGLPDHCDVVVDSWSGFENQPNGLRQVTKQTAPYAVPAGTAGYLGTPPAGKQFWTSAVSDVLGRTTATTNPDGTQTTFQYGIETALVVERDSTEKDRLVEQWLAYTEQTQTVTRNSIDAPQVTRTYTNALGNTVWVKSALSPYVYYQYDVSGRLLHARLWDGLTTTTESGIVYAAGSSTDITYDLAGRKLSLDDADMGEWEYAYNALGNLTRQKDAETQVTCLYYDPLNRLKGKNYQGDTACPPDPGGSYEIAYTYDGATSTNSGIGRRTGMQDNSGSTIWEYDLRGRLIHEAKTVIDYQDPANQQDNLGLGTYHTYWSYNSDDSARQMVYPNGETVNFAYHAQGAISRLSSIQDETEQTRDYLTSAGYDAAGRTLSRMMGSGIAQAYTYYPWTQQGGRLQAMTAQRGVESYQNLAYSYDQVGNILQISDAVANEALVFTYDDLNRLDLVSGAYSEDPVYSASNGNISTRNGVTYTYGDNAHVHAVTSTGGRSFGYDLNGNMIMRALSSAEVYQLTYDEANQLVEIEQAASGNSWVDVGRYVYDGDGKRVLSVVEGARTVYIGGYFEAELGLQVTYPVEVPEIVSSYDHYVNKVYFPVVFGNGSAGLGMTEGNFGNTYYHTHPSQTGQSGITWRMYYSVGSTNIAMRVQGNSESYELHYMLADHLGGTVRTVRQDGLASELRYSAWGETRWSTSVTTPTEKQYTGQYKAEAGLYFYQSRFYDGSLGRFISPDTIIPGPYYSLSWDRYAGMANNPIVHNDPSGHCIDGLTTAVCIVGGAMILGAIGGYAYQVYENRMTGMSLGEALTTNISAEKVLQGAVIGGGVVVGAATLSAGLAAVGITVGAACVDGDCTNEAQAAGSSLSTIRNMTGNAKGTAYEEWVVKVTGGEGSYKLPGAQYDNKVGNVLMEVKAFNWLNMKPGGREFTEIQNQIGRAHAVATQNGYQYLVRMLNKPPQFVIDWLEKKGYDYFIESQ